MEKDQPISKKGKAPSKKAPVKVVQKVMIKEMPPKMNKIQKSQKEEKNPKNVQLPSKPKVGSLQLISNKEEDKEKKVVAIIISFCSGATYDNIFTTVEQKSMEGTRVLVYSCGTAYIFNMIKAFNNDPQDEVAKQLMIHMKEVDSDCVVFNWECCSGYSGQKFTQGKQALFKLLKIILDRQHMAMFSDFSLKALIHDWDVNTLGPNPFKKISETSEQFLMKFKPATLKQCASAQLQIIGDLAEGGQCHVHCLGGTIVYTVDKSKLKHDHYTLEVLSINSTYKAKLDQNLTCSIGEDQGVASHCMLKFKSGGLLLTSMGHWIQLMKIDTSEKALLEIAEREFGQEEASKIRKECESMGVEEKKQYVQMKAKSFVQNQAPCKNMSKKARM